MITTQLTSYSLVKISTFRQQTSFQISYYTHDYAKDVPVLVAASLWVYSIQTASILSHGTV